MARLRWTLRSALLLPSFHKCALPSPCHAQVATILQTPSSSCPVMPSAEMPSDALESFDMDDGSDVRSKQQRNGSGGSGSATSAVLSSVREPS